MFIFEKKLQYPIRITKPDARMAKLIAEQYGGGDGELAASLRYLSQRFAAVTDETAALLTDVGTEDIN